MKKTKVIIALLYLFVTLAISFWLQYQVLKRVEATELMMFLFWVNVPVAAAATFILKVLEDK